MYRCLDRCPPGLTEINPTLSPWAWGPISCAGCGQLAGEVHLAACPIRPPKRQNVTRDQAWRTPHHSRGCWRCDTVVDAWQPKTEPDCPACGATSIPPDFQI